MTTPHDKVLAGTAKPVQATTDVSIVIDPPGHIGRNVRHPHGSQEYWTALAKEYQGWVNAFEEFLRDHRSQDANVLRVERRIETVCSRCFNPWESETVAGERFCAGCGATLTEQPSKLDHPAEAVKQE